MVDDSASARALLGVRLRHEGYEVDEVAHAADAVDAALRDPPDAIVTDLWMPGISGLQLCRLLRAEPATAKLPVVLLTASDDRRSRFWARHAGATAYVTKTEIGRLTALLADLTTSPKTALPPSPHPPAQPVPRGTVQERLSQLLDVSLFESTIAGEVRALSQNAEELERMFEALCALASDVASYRWLALSINPAQALHIGQPTTLLIHAHPDRTSIAQREARDALEVGPRLERRRSDGGDAFVIADKRAIDADWSTPPIVRTVHFGSAELGKIALGPGRRGASHDDRRLMEMIAFELGGPLRMAALVAEAHRLASTDTLTGLLNRRAFAEQLDKARAADKSLLPMGVLLLDIDHFKKVNDTLGHDAGDAVLQGVARVLDSFARKSDLVARWGGEEFVVAIPTTAQAGARVAAERVRRAIAEARYLLPDGSEHRATASVGLAHTTDDAWLLSDLLARADKAMYAAKHRGRNRVETA